MTSERLILGGESFRYLTGDKVDRILNLALENNVKSIDTSSIYGESEQLIGKFSKRKDFQISTKVGFPGQSILNPKDILQSFHNSLIKLKVDSVSTLYLHTVKPESITDEIIVTLNKFVELGKCEKIGFSGDGKDLEIVIGRNIFSKFMCTLNVVDQANYNTIRNNEHLEWVFKRVLANGIWNYTLKKRLHAFREKLAGVENSFKNDLYYERFKLLRNEMKVKKFEIENILNFPFREFPNSKISVGVRSEIHLKQLVDFSSRLTMLETISNYKFQKVWRDLPSTMKEVKS